MVRGEEWTGQFCLPLTDSELDREAGLAPHLVRTKSQEGLCTGRPCPGRLRPCRGLKPGALHMLILKDQRVNI